MPVDYRLYPSNWNEIRKAVLIRAGGSSQVPMAGAQCEHCGVRNYSVGYYMSNGNFVTVKRYDVAKKARAEARRLREETGDKYRTICLAVAHIDDPNPANCDMGNLKALCQRCHHIHDLTLKKQRELIRKRKQQIARGQLTINF